MMIIIFNGSSLVLCAFLKIFWYEVYLVSYVPVMLFILPSYRVIESLVLVIAQQFCIILQTIVFCMQQFLRGCFADFWVMFSTLHLLFSILEGRKSTFELPLGVLNVLKFIVVSDTLADKENHSHQGCCRAMVVVCLLCFHHVLDCTDEVMHFINVTVSLQNIHIFWLLLDLWEFVHSIIIRAFFYRFHHSYYG